MFTIRFCFLLLLGSLFFAAPTQAQITIDRSDFQAEIGQVLTSQDFSTTDATGLQALVDAGGGNQTWDFTGKTYENSAAGTFVVLPMPADVPGATEPEFVNASHVTVIDLSGATTASDSTAWTFQTVNDDGVFSHGIFFRTATDLDGDGNAPDEAKISYAPALQQASFPQTFGTAWNSATTQSLSAGGFSFDTEVAMTAVVDGFGTLITPAGTAACLRTKQDLTVTVFGFSITTTTYLFETKEGISASIAVDPVTMQAASASYTVRGEGGGGVDVEQVGLDVPDGLRIDGNYPNPFAQSTTIRYDLPEAAHVRLGVYDVMGREVAVPVDQFQTPGQYAADFNAGSLPSGTYVYRLTAGGRVHTRTLQVVK